MWAKIEKRIYKIQEAFIAIALLIIMLAVILQIVGRLAGWHSLGMPEYAAIGMTVITFIGASAITYTRDYIAIELNQMIKSRKVQLIFHLIVDVIIIVFAVLFINISWTFLQFVVASGEKTLEVEIPLSIPYGLIVLGILLMLIHSVSNVIKDIVQLRALNKGREA
ncbi:TRAP transporter small permease [Lysinibacillus louembei]|uniref:TRAP transporter small permease n=1 Tax=Lysinibacillus louembei TaxID=1470088 RepID=A0ABZ0RZU4_9BACI|nr:TRAP transporter small permease [Lysinibacillus louembei]WPK12817.1 TRAP transporter small permease [Lysinibacillus louembei]